MQVQLNEFDFCLKKLFDLPSSFVLIIGDWKTGKTDFALLIAERLLELRIVSKVASNIKTWDSPVEFIDNLPTLKEWLHKGKERKLYIFDEAGIHLHRRRSMSKKNIGFMTLLPEISKAHARMIGITQNPMSIDKELLSPVWCKGLIFKLSKLKVRIVSELLPPGEEVKEFFPVPKTNIPFDPYAIAPFKLTAPTQVPANLKDRDLQILWEWSVNNKTAHNLGLHTMQINRIVKKFVRQVLLEQFKTTQ